VYAGWKVRPESVQTRLVGGQQALSAIADYIKNAFQADSTSQNGAAITMKNPAITNIKMVEYLIWVRSPKTHVVFFGRAKAEDLGTLQSGMDELAATAVIP